MLRGAVTLGTVVLMAVPALAPIQVADAEVVPGPVLQAGPSETGIATWYGASFEGLETANGERFSRHQLTAAHRTFPMGSMMLVTDLQTGRSIAVRINDRGPWIQGRIADLSEAAARELGIRERGVARVRLDLLGGADLN